MSTATRPPKKATYVVTELDKSWLRSEARKLYARSMENVDYVFRKLWGLVTDPRNLRIAFARVAGNRGRRTAGVDRITVERVLARGVEPFLEQLRVELRAGTYQPSPVRRILIPKQGHPGKFRPLGIPTVRDRVVQSAMKNIMEPIFEPDFYPSSYGFRPGKSAHGAIEHLRKLLRPKTAERRLPYQWAIEGDIKGCFDNIDHHAVMVRVRQRVGDTKVNRLVLAFLRAGVLAGEQFSRTHAGTPQGGILSPLLANIALSELDERYEQVVWPRRNATRRRHSLPLSTATRIEAKARMNRHSARRSGRTVLFPIRYADDFIVLVGAPPGPGQFERARTTAVEERAAIAALLKERLGLELSEEKTLVTPVTERMNFLGHRIVVRPHPCDGRMVVTNLVPKEASHRFRETIKQMFQRHTLHLSLANRLRVLNPMLRGWGNYYRHAWGAKKVLNAIDYYVWSLILRWLCKKHRRRVDYIVRRYRRRPSGASGGWQDGDVVLFNIRSISVRPFQHGWLRTPDFASTSMESPVHNERCTPGSGRGARKPAR
jgi:RNA-directed DNA polymerase